MIARPKFAKLSLVVFLFILVSFSVWFFYLNRSRENESKGAIKKYQEIANKIDVSSDVSGIELEKNNSEVFFEYLDEWDIFGENRFFLKSIEDYVLPEKVGFYLTNKEQPYNWFVYNPGKGSEDIVVASAGEVWDKNSKKLVFLIYFNPLMLENSSMENSNNLFNSFIMNLLYERTHRDNLDYYIESRTNIINLLNKEGLPFTLKKNE